MINWQDIVVTLDKPILQVVEIINKGALGAALVVNTDGKLVGLVTDGDLRRGMLRCVATSEPVSCIMNASPTSALRSELRQNILSKMHTLSLRHMPIVDETGRLVGLETMEHLLLKPSRKNWVVLMAGGLGSRLQPLTDDCPKPLLKVGTKPILETVLENFIEHGFSNFHFAINYKGHLIQDYFGDGARWDVNVNYLCEEERLGTAGALSLLPEKPTLPILVMNADLMTKVNFQQLMDFHHEHNASATLCVREYKHVIPFGVVHISKDNYQLIDIKEKPEQNLFVNAGIYVLNPEVLDFVPKNRFYDMPDLLTRLMQEKQKVNTFPIREYWLDVGRLEDLKQAHRDYDTMFS